MVPTDILKEEHKIIKDVLQAMKAEALKIKETGEVNTSRIKKFIKFSREFTDGSHHKKEENHLFPTMGKKGFSEDSGPVAMMLMEHVEGRKFIGQIEENVNKIEDGDESAKAPLYNAILNYIVLLVNHINKEDNILFKMADKVLDNKAQGQLSDAFERVDNEETNGQNKNALVNLAGDIISRDI